MPHVETIMKTVISQHPRRHHWHYFKNITGAVVNGAGLGIEHPNAFPILLNKTRFNVDYGDCSIIRNCLSPCLKFHLRTQINGFFPFSPISFLDWKEYEECSTSIKYTCRGENILANQRPRGGAKTRRDNVHKILAGAYGNAVDTSITAPAEWWNKVSNCLVAVCVPGCFHNILDRGQFQLMALGCCTISPKILEWLPFWKRFKDGVHYVECRNDYTDLLQKIEWCRENRQACVAIGQAAKELFQETSTPSSIANWLEGVI